MRCSSRRVAVKGGDMSVLDIFSKRQKKLRGDVPDVYTYDTIPQPLRVQIIHIWRETLGDEARSGHWRGVMWAYRMIVDTLCKEYGVFKLHSQTENYGLERN
jgi:hypothetical protein